MASIVVSLMMTSCVLLTASAANCPNIVPRSSWGALPPKQVTPLNRPVATAVFLHTDTPPCSTSDKCAARVRNIQSYHVGEGWDDIGYNFLISEDGNVYEGRGWLNRGAFSVEHNSRGYGIAFIGYYGENTVNVPPTVAIRAAKNLLECGVSLGHLTSSYTVESRYVNHLVESLLSFV